MRYRLIPNQKFVKLARVHENGTEISLTLTATGPRSFRTVKILPSTAELYAASIEAHLKAGTLVRVESAA